MSMLLIQHYLSFFFDKFISLFLYHYLSRPEPNYKDRHVTTAAHLYGATLIK